MRNVQAMYSTESQIVDRHITSTDKLKAIAEQFKVPTIYWLPKLNKKPFKFLFISASSKCTTTNYVLLIADLFFYCYESQFMVELHKDLSKTDLIDKFNKTYRYLDDMFSVNNSDFYK